MNVLICGGKIETKGKGRLFLGMKLCCLNVILADSTGSDLKGLGSNDDSNINVTLTNGGFLRNVAVHC